MMQTPVQRLLTFLIAAIILGVIALVSWRLSPSPQPNTVSLEPPEDWPTPIASVTPTVTSTPFPTALPSETPTVTPSPTPIVIGSLEELGQLITVNATLQTIVELQRERGILLAPERIILAAVGNVKAGVDLAQVMEGDIIIDGTSVKITLPPAAVTSIEILPGETEVFDSSRGWFLSEYEGLEIEALDKARTQLEGWAVNRIDILKQAEEQAQTQLNDFLRQLGFEEIEIVFER